MSPADDHPVLDDAVVARLRELGAAVGEDLLGQVAAIYLAELGPRLDRLRDAVAEEDREALAQAAHTLRGSSANLGANGLAEVCAKIESDPAARPAALIVAVEREAERVRTALVEIAGGP